MTTHTFNKDDLVRRAENAPSYDHETQIGYVQAGVDYKVTRVTGRKVLIRDADEQRARDYGSFWVLKEHVVPSSTVPESVLDRFENPDGTAKIAVTDPRIQYIFAAARSIADDKGFCSEFDTMMTELGLPGRERVWHVTYTVAELDGAEGTMPIKATSQEGAEAKVLELVPGATVSYTENYYD